MSKKKKQQNSSSLMLGQERSTLIKRQLRKSEEKCQTLQGDYKKLYERSLIIESKLKENEKKYEEIAREYKETKEKLQEAKEGEVIEKLLKNESYAFLLAEGLLDKFLEFREHFHRTKAQDALYNLVAEASLGGLWIDL